MSCSACVWGRHGRATALRPLPYPAIPCSSGTSASANAPLEQFVVFPPALWLFARYASPRLAALLGLVFIAARFVYERGYLDDPKRRETGAIMTAVTTGILLLGGLIGAIVQAL